MTEDEPDARLGGLDQPRGPTVADGPLQPHAGGLDGLIDAILEAGQPLLVGREYGGREARSSFGRFTLLFAAIIIVGCGMDLLVFVSTPRGVPPFFTVFFAITLLPAFIAIGVRRLRDASRRDPGPASN